MVSHPAAQFFSSPARRFGILETNVTWVTEVLWPELAKVPYRPLSLSRGNLAHPDTTPVRRTQLERH
jgi:hypothetical protein